MLTAITKDYIISLLDAIPGIHYNRMFRHVGVYHCGHFIGIITNGSLYLRTNRLTRGAYMAIGSSPYDLRDRLLHRFYRVPDTILLNKRLFIRWAHDAIAIKDRQQSQQFEFRA